VRALDNTPGAADKVETFKRRTREKLQDVRCPVHHQPPRLKFEGSSLRDVRVSLSACCDHLSRMANQAIAS
jgi:hypothetical protein